MKLLIVLDPFFLCNLIYKIISKVIANIIKSILPLLISSIQSSYVEGHKIMDNIIQYCEIIHSLKSMKKLGMIMQLDMVKSFDNLSWGYMKEIL